MIIRIQRGGKSFKWLGTYLTHDAGKAQTSKRVDWTETLNLAHSHVSSAIDEMYWSYRAADQLKRAAGILTGGTRLQNPVKHLSLNWHPSDQPTREEMVAAVKDFVRHMGWQDHQAVLIAHNDRPHKHVHVMVNVVSPLDGRGLDAGYEFNRSSAWGLEYERARFRIHCEQRLKPYEEREPAPTRENWLRMKGAEQGFDQEEAAKAARTPDYFERHDPATWQAKEWTALKSHHREVREHFFADGKRAFRETRNQVFREVRTEFRGHWRAYYAAKSKGLAPKRLALMKSAIVEQQKVELDARREAACAELRGHRDADYRQILLEQKMERGELKARQAQGIRSPHLLDAIHEHREDRAHQERHRDSDESLTKEFRGAAKEVGERAAETKEQQHETPRAFEGNANEPSKVREPIGAIGGLGLGAIGALATVAERLFEGFFGGPHPNQRAPAQPKPVTREPVNDNAARAAERAQRTRTAEATEAARLYEYWQERKRQRSRDRD